MDSEDAFGLRSTWLECRDWAREAVDEAYKSAEAFADAESHYQTIKHRNVMAMKLDGMPVTLIQTAIKGVGEVNSALHARDYAELMHKVDLKAIDVAIQQEREAFKDYERAMNGS